MQNNNVVVLLGRLTRDPELNTTKSGVEVCSFAVAVDRGYAKQGEEKQTDFIECQAWQKTGVFVNTYFHKGEMISILGSLRSEKYTDKEGKNRTAWKVNCEQVGFVGGKRDGSVQNNAPAPVSSDPVDAATDDFPF